MECGKEEREWQRRAKRANSKNVDGGLYDVTFVFMSAFIQYQRHGKIAEVGDDIDVVCKESGCP